VRKNKSIALASGRKLPTWFEKC